MWTTVLRLLDVAAIVYLVIGAADYGIQKWQFLRQNKMTKDEVKRESKDREGDPRLKSERRKLAREFATTAPSLSMSRANMLVVNPTHYAVAVRYEPRETPLPIVIARGVDEQAATLRRIALSLSVPIVANPPVARALYKVPLYQPIPADLLEIVAAILRWVDSVGAKRSSEENAS
jgi:type III secretion protein U